MTRVKRGVTHTKKRARLRKLTKGYKWGRKSSIKLGKTAVTKAGAHAYRDRKKKKRNARGLWQIKISALAKSEGLSYSKLIAKLKSHQIELDRKILADLAVNHQAIFKQIIQSLK